VVIVVGLALELASCVSFVILFRRSFDRVAARDARLLAWTNMASGALLPGGGVGGLAIGGWLIHLTGAPTHWVIKRSSGLFLLTSAVNGAAVIGAGALLLTGAPGPHDFARAGLPALLALAATLRVLALPAIARRRQRPSRGLDGIVGGIREAQHTAAHPSWRLLGALGYPGFDIAVLWVTLSAVGQPPSIPALVLAYSIGYLANTLPIPGGIGCSTLASPARCCSTAPNPDTSPRPCSSTTPSRCGSPGSAACSPTPAYDHVLPNRPARSDPGPPSLIPQPLSSRTLPCMRSR
jgi:uncharacterized membrane protein YbhN (UPF0104 family)